MGETKVYTPNVWYYWSDERVRTQEEPARHLEIWIPAWHHHKATGTPERTLLHSEPHHLIHEIDTRVHTTSKGMRTRDTSGVLCKAES